MPDTSVIPNTLEFLQGLEPLEAVPADQLEWFIKHSEVREFNKGEQVFDPDTPADYLIVVLEGKFQVRLKRNGEIRQFGDMLEGDITGILPYSRMTRTSAIATAKEPAKVLTFHKEGFPDMIRDHFELTQALVHVMTNRVRAFTTLQIQNEKLMSLGKLSAGLAHELNNPASAIVRSANNLRDHLKGQPDKFKKVIDIKMTHEQVDTVNDLLFRKIDEHKSNQLSLMDRTDLEDDLTDWLEDNGVENAFDIVENLVEFGFSVDDLEKVREHTDEEHFLPVIGWLESNLSTEKMVEEIQEASVRIADLIKSIKGYTHMDRSQDQQEVDIHEGIRSTITMLKHKIKKGQIILVENFDESIPQVKGFPGELNQVWTNILDNAIDALAEHQDNPNPSITLTSRLDGDFVRVYIKDNGPGIPEDVVSKIFDPFYTTKELGKGTGLGLDVVMKIIRKHRGEIKVKSEPGMTEFEVCLPIG